jgi:dTDP-4-dehydrorhamnose reductase
LGSALVFGASGFLGPHVLRCLRRSGIDAVAAGRTAIPDSLAAGADFVSCDGMKKHAGLDSIESVRGHKPQALFFLSAVSSMAAAEADRASAWRINVEWPRELAYACAESRIPFVYASTDLVFGGSPPSDGAHSYSEGEVPSPIGAYGESKRDGEQAVLDAHPGALVLRLPLLYGDSFGRGLGASDGLLQGIEASREPNGQPASPKPLLFTDELRCAMDAKDAARAMVLFGGCGGGLDEAVGARLSDIEGRAGILHLGGGARLTRAELGLQLLGRAGIDPDAALAAVRLGTQADAGLEGKRAKRVCLDSSSARRLLAGGGLELEEEPLEPGKSA